MGDQVVALENETNGVVSVAVPVLAFEILGGFAANDEIAGGILVQTADDIQ